MTDYNTMTIKALTALLKEKSKARLLHYQSSFPKTKKHLIEVLQFENEHTALQQQLDEGPVLLVPFRAVDREADLFRSLQATHHESFSQDFEAHRFYRLNPSVWLVTEVLRAFPHATYRDFAKHPNTGLRVDQLVQGKWYRIGQGETFLRYGGRSMFNQYSHLFNDSAHNQTVFEQSNLPCLSGPYQIAWKLEE